jgi:Zn-dependent protease
MLMPQGSRLYLGQFGAIPVFVDISALVLVALVFTMGGTLQDSILILIILVSGIMLHEAGHGYAALGLGARNVTITIQALGGVCESHRTRERPLGEIWILAAGPLVSFALAGLCYIGLDWLPERLLAHEGGLTVLGRLLLYGQWINLTVGIFNMLPIFPLDGGQIVWNGLRLFLRDIFLINRITLILAVVTGLMYLAWRFSEGTPVIGWSTFMVGFLLFNAWLFLHGPRR